MPRGDRTGPRGAGPRTGRGLGDCGGQRRQDGSGNGVGNRGTNRQPPPRRSK